MGLGRDALTRALRADADGVRLVVVVKPKSSKEGVEEAKDGAVAVRVQAPPEDGKANARVIIVVADALDVPRSHVSIVRGQAARHKELLIRGISVEEASTRLSHA